MHWGFEQLTDSESGASLEVRRAIRNVLSLTVGVMALTWRKVEVTLLDGRQRYSR
jgi:hypothetical protein